MAAFLQEFSKILGEGIWVSLYLTFLPTLLAYLLGLPLGVMLYCIKPGGIAENRLLNSLFGWLINMGRSIPFIILMYAITPFTRALTGTSIGSTAALVPLTLAAVPFVARMVEQSMEEVDIGVIEAARCMGATNGQIIRHVLISESVPGLVRGLSITTITLLGYSAITGSIGAGGLGDIAVRYGYYRYQPNVMVATIVLLILIVCVIQALFSFMAKRLDKRSR